jgi:hypothetical protein
VEPEDQARICQTRNQRRGAGRFRHSAGSILADLGEHQLTIRDCFRHSHLNVTNQYLRATSNTKRFAQEKLVKVTPPTASRSASKSTHAMDLSVQFISAAHQRLRVGFVLEWKCLLDPNGPRFLEGFFGESLKELWVGALEKKAWLRSAGVT